MDIILSHPFSGALYAFFTEQAKGEPVPAKIRHPYYYTLYGKKHSDFRDLALTQLLIYENVFIIPADNELPEAENNFSGGDYINKQLGLYTSWDIQNQLRKEIEYQIKSDLEDPVISKILMKAADVQKQQILHDARLEIALANKYDCPILSAGGRTKIIKRLSEIDEKRSKVKEISRGSILATETYVNTIGLAFNPINYDLLYTYKQDKAVRSYARAFRRIIGRIEDPAKARLEMLLLLRNSIETQGISKKASGIFDVASILLSIAGFIPTVGLFLSGAGLLATGVSKFIDKSATRTWYEFGQRIKRISDVRVIESKIDKELNNT
jgi:hypothetical protein